MNSQRLLKKWGIWAVVIFVSTLVLDVWSKDWAVQALSKARISEVPRCEPAASGYIEMQRDRKESISVIDDYLEYRYAENCGAAFSMLRDASPNVRRIVFGFASFIAAITLGWMFIKQRKTWPLVVGLSLVASGAVGNLIDRVKQEYVIDFIHFHWNTAWDYPTFNVADVSISFGVVFLLLDGLIGKRYRAPESTSNKKSNQA